MSMPVPTSTRLLLNAVLLSTKSRGNMTITSAYTLDQLVISPNWLEEGDVDLERAYTAFQRMREIGGNYSIGQAAVYPGANTTTKDDIISYLRQKNEPSFPRDVYV
ncbi:hypothetical protein BDW71DRAFT_212564 [Aspergillus fruticulosus]